MTINAPQLMDLNFKIESLVEKCIKLEKNIVQKDEMIKSLNN